MLLRFSPFGTDNNHPKATARTHARTSFVRAANAVHGGGESASNHPSDAKMMIHQSFLYSPLFLLQHVPVVPPQELSSSYEWMGGTVPSFWSMTSLSSPLLWRFRFGKISRRGSTAILQGRRLFLPSSSCRWPVRMMVVVGRRGGSVRICGVHGWFCFLSYKRRHSLGSLLRHTSHRGHSYDAAVSLLLTKMTLFLDWADPATLVVTLRGGDRDPAG
jgi:hypothetical protein